MSTMSTMSNQETKMRTIALTDRPPVRIREDAWPVIAHGRYRNHDNQYEFQANRRWRADVRVRQHADGRAIVYGVYEYETAYQGERGFNARVGELVAPGGDLVEAIRRVGASIGEAADVAGRDYRAHIDEAVRGCIADLPAEDL